jgi:hypothetical protein
VISKDSYEMASKVIQEMSLVLNVTIEKGDPRLRDNESYKGYIDIRTGEFQGIGVLVDSDGNSVEGDFENGKPGKITVSTDVNGLK